MNPELPNDPRLQNIDNELVEIVAQEFKQNIDLVGIHLRDARNILVALKKKDDGVLAKAALLLAAAALESNLIYLSKITLRFADKRPKLFLKPQLDYLKGLEETIDERGQIVERSLKQSLEERLQIVPTLLARAVARSYKLPVRSSALKKLRRTIERRDAIVHPRWDKYVPQLGWWEAAEALDAVELYLNSVVTTLHPYLVGHIHVLYTIPGYDHHEVATGYRTVGKRGPNRKVSTMDEIGIRDVLLNEWTDSIILTHLALDSKCEGDSEGSMLTRAALVLLYAMLDAQLSVVAQWRMRETPSAFKDPEILFLNEYAVGVGHDGEVWVGDDQHTFKTRIKAIPAILARRVDGKEANVDLGKQWGEHLLQGYRLRNKVMHSALGESLPRVTKRELATASKAVLAYFEEVASKAPSCFEYVRTLLRTAADLTRRLDLQI